MKQYNVKMVDKALPQWQSEQMRKQAKKAHKAHRSIRKERNVSCWN